ncbi:MAG: spore coat protein YlbD [Tuberibacillus sp.]
MVQKTEEAVKAFKSFVRSHPEIIKGVKEQGKTWKDVFDEYVLFGENHEIWEAYGIKKEVKKKPRGANEFMRILDFIGNLDAKTVQDRLEQLNGALTNIQELIQIWQPQQGPQQPHQGFPMQGFGPQNNPFNGSLPPMQNNFRRD